ncbi:MAG: methyl-accepting chemotaxis protein [Bacillota bacterium]
MKMTLGKKLYAGFISVLLLLGVVATVSTWGLQSVTATYEDITNRLHQVSVEALHVDVELQTKARTVLGYLATGQPNYKTEYLTAQREIADGLSKLKELVQTPEGKALLKRIETASAEYDRNALPLFDRSNFTKEEMLAAIDTLRASRGEAATASSELVALAKQISQDGARSASLAAAGTRMTGIITAIVAAITGLVIAYFISRSVTRPILQLKAQIGELAAGGGDLTKQLAVTSRDEVGDLVSTFNTFLGTLRGLLLEVRESSLTVGASSTQLNSSTNQVASASQSVAEAITRIAAGASEQGQVVSATTEVVEQLRTAINQIATGASEQARGAQSTATVVSSMVSAIQDVTQKANGVASSSQMATERAHKGREVVEAAVVGMDRIRQTVQETAEQILRLDQLSEQIGTITETITGIADQTNLLALNAAIEAARAGEHGRGFAVVAEEVRKLAERAGRSATEIADLVKAVQNGTSTAVKAMDEGRVQAEEGSRLAAAAGSALQEIIGMVDQTTQHAVAIRQAADHIAGSSREVAQAVESMAAITEENTAATEQMAASSDEVIRAVRQVQSVTQRDAALAEEVASSVEEMSASAEEMAASAEALAAVAKRLQGQIERFKL